MPRVSLVGHLPTSSVSNIRLILWIEYGVSWAFRRDLIRAFLSSNLSITTIQCLSVIPSF